MDSLDVILRIRFAFGYSLNNLDKQRVSPDHSLAEGLSGLAPAIARGSVKRVPL